RLQNEYLNILDEISKLKEELKDLKDKVLENNAMFGEAAKQRKRDEKRIVELREEISKYSKDNF
ncbi:MAG: hypothetical protein Q8T08_20260, partial [Ignavibacteria bacterium]|nr:hypothetical protein [Ignavibacteria bacterium]